MSDFGSTAKAATCGNCRRPIWKLSTGSGFDVRLDTDPLSPPLELLARQIGRQTFTARKWAVTAFIAEIRLKQEMGSAGVVLAEHKCDYPLTHPQKHPDYWNRKPNEPASDTCPF